MTITRDPKILCEAHLRDARKHETEGQLTLSLRELKEALRIRPRDPVLKGELERIQSLISAARCQSDPVSADRISSLFNLGIRYWDRNMPGVAIKECQKAREQLEVLGLPTTCADHNISVMRDILSSTRSKELELRALIDGKKKNNLPANYQLATVYFDRKMLHVAEKHLMRCRDLAKTLVELESTRKSRQEAALSSRECDSRCSSRRPSMDPDSTPRFNPAALSHAQDKLRGIVDDILHVKELQGMYCTLTDQVKVLPCLLSRFTNELSECEEWWTDIRTTDKLCW